MLYDKQNSSYGNSNSKATRDNYTRKSTFSKGIYYGLIKEGLTKDASYFNRVITILKSELAVYV